MAFSIGLPQCLYLLLCEKLAAVTWAGWHMDPEPALWVLGAAQGIDHRNTGFNLL